MELKRHFFFEIPVFLVLYGFLGFYSAVIITLAHFIPTIDYIMLRLNLMGELHRKLFHNIFTTVIAGALLCLFFGILTAILGLLNMVFHFILDLDEHGIMVFFPFSGYRLKRKKGYSKPTA